MPERNADLVLEGGGVKGIALAGAYSVIEEQGYTLKRIAGTSAGSIVGALLAAGTTADELKALMSDIRYDKFEDESLLGRLPLLGKPLSIAYRQGINKGQYAHDWIRDQLAAHGVKTFADLRYNDPKFVLPEAKRYKLVVMVSDISRGQLLSLPWGYPDYGQKADEQQVADAVRASMSIPFFFEPVRLKNLGNGQDSVLVDGGMLSNFPVGVFDATQGDRRWPTFGIKLSAKPGAAEKASPGVHGAISMTKAMIKTMTGFYDRMYVDRLDVQRRTIFVDTGSIPSTKFDLTPDDAKWLYESGRDAATRFFDGGDGQPKWDWEAYKADFPVGTT
ncbi:MAG TPA: patatin-like phospholipase family protein [Nocardioidaceae bacterium]|nr:patatin-like phospholipase family protein [Nocardioidaceae bacterium]